MRTCDTVVARQLPFCNTSLSFETRAWDIINRLTTAEKVPLMVNSAGGVARLGIAPYQWW